MLTKLSLEQIVVPEEQSEEALRLKQLQAQAMQAFRDEDDEDDDSESSHDEENIERNKYSSVRVRAPGA